MSVYRPNRRVGVMRGVLEDVRSIVQSVLATVTVYHRGALALQGGMMRTIMSGRIMIKFRVGCGFDHSRIH